MKSRRIAVHRASRELWTDSEFKTKGAATVLMQN
jgi:hypothetical protein